MKSIFIILIITIPLFIQAKTVTCKKGKHRCSRAGLPWPIKTNFRGKIITFKQNSDYQKFWSDAPYLQVNKLFGLTDCGTYTSSRKKSAMIGWRNIQGPHIELLAYVHRPDINNSGTNFYHAPIGLTRKNEVNHISISNHKDFYIYQANYQNYTIMRRACNKRVMRGRQINHWFGGRRKSPAKIKISDHPLSKKVHHSLSQETFPKMVRFAGKDICQQERSNNFLKNHPSQIYQTIKNECHKSINIQYLGCHKEVSSKYLKIKSSNSLDSLTFLINCQ